MSDPQEATDPTRPISAQPEVAPPAADEAATTQGEAAAEGSVLVADAAPEQDDDADLTADAETQDAQPVAGVLPVDAAPGIAPPPPHGAPQAYQGSPAPTGTDGMAIAGLVLAFLAWPVGLGLSIAALVRTRRSGRPGRGLAIAGIVVSALAFIASVISLIFFVTAGIALVEAEEERAAAAAEVVDAAEAAAAVEAAEEAAAAAAATASEAPAAELPPVVEGSLLLPGSVAGLTGKERGCEILFADDPNSFYSLITTADATIGPDDAAMATMVQLVEAAKPDLGAEHAADADALLALFRPETQALPEAEMIAALTEGSSAAERLATACVGGL